MFAKSDETQFIVNIGGMANLTLLPPQTSGQAVRGWDTGPGHVLMDAWIQRHQGLGFDANGDWASQGSLLPTLFSAFQRDGHSFFAQEPPKSTGRESFDLAWVDEVIRRWRQEQGTAQPDAANVQATLCELTAWSVAHEIRRGVDALKADGVLAPLAPVLVCGGGAFNVQLLKRLTDQLSAQGLTTSVKTTAQEGMPPDQVEALAFAWLAWQFVRAKPGNLPAVTGATGFRRLGCWTPAH